MFLRKIIRKWLIVIVLIFLIGTFFVCVSYSHPSEDVINREFSLRNPNSEIININLVFDEVAVATYQIEYRETLSEKIFTKQITLHQCMNWDWKIDYRDCGK
jgi:hypothetical protein